MGGVDLVRLDCTKLHLKVSRSACLEVNQVRRALRRARLQKAALATAKQLVIVLTVSLS